MPGPAPLIAAALAGALGLSGCAAGPGSSASPRPQPVTLSYLPAAAGSAEDLARAREIATALSGVYVRVLMMAPPEPRSGRDAVAARGIVTGASGAIVDKRGYVVTAAHIAMRVGLEARITTIDGRAHEAAVVAVAPERELALLKMRPYPGMQAASLGDSSVLKAGDAVLTIGTPDDKTGVVLVGRVSNPRRKERIEYDGFGYDDAIELVLDAEPGNSGGPLFNHEAELIGIVASFSLGNTNPDEYEPTRLAWAVPSNAIAAYLREVTGP